LNEVTALSFKQYMDIKGSQCTCKQTSTKPCGTYCKKTGPKQQRRIILDILRRESLNKGKEIKRYLINQRWWTSWCDYVNFEHKNAMQKSFDINLIEA